MVNTHQLIDQIVDQINNDGAFPFAKSASALANEVMKQHREGLTRCVAILEASGADQESINEIYESTLWAENCIKEIFQGVMTHSDRIDTANRDFILSLRNII